MTTGLTYAFKVLERSGGKGEQQYVRRKSSFSKTDKRQATDYCIVLTGKIYTKEQQIKHIMVKFPKTKGKEENLQAARVI